MKSLIYTVYRHGNAGLSNLIMSIELAVVLSRLTDRVLILEGNRTPPANVVQYEGIVGNTYPSRVTDLIDLGVAWIDADQLNLAAFAPHEICDQPAGECVFYFPAHLSIETDDMRSFAGLRKKFITVGEDLQNVPALSFSGGAGAVMLSFYSYFFYLDQAAQMLAHDALRQFKPKRELAVFAERVADDLGRFNAVHIRRGDFKKTFGVTTLDRTPTEVIEALDQHFSRDDRLVILTDEAEDPFFDEIKATYADHVFLDHHILENYRSDFLELPAHDSIALAYLSQLIAARSSDFIGTMSSTFTSLIQRKRGNLGKDEPFKFLWNELPDSGDKLERGRHRISNCIPLEKGIMVEQNDGPYSWNRFNERLNPAWMREWPEGFLEEAAMVERARGREIAVAAGIDAETAAAPTPQTDGGSCIITFRDSYVAASSNREDVTRSITNLFAAMISASESQPMAEVRIECLGDEAKLLVDGQVTATGPMSSKLLRSSYREVVCRFIDRHPDLVWLHAGSAASSTGAVVLPGAWGRGKSSVVIELQKRGWSFLSDDIAPLDTAEGTVIPFPGTPQVRPKADIALLREELTTLEKSEVPIDPKSMADGPKSLSMIVFPHFTNGAAAELTPISPGQAVGMLLENCLSFIKNEDETVRQLCALVESVPIYSLQFDDVSEAADLIIDAYEPADQPTIAIDGSDQEGEVEMETMEEAQTIDVEVTLIGGLHHATILPANSPILHDLYAGLAARQLTDPQRKDILFQLPLDGGHAAVSFMSTSLVSVTTRPPVLIQQQHEPVVQHPAEQISDAPACVRIDDFLTPDENKQLLKFALANESDFEGSTVMSGEKGHRQSRVLFTIDKSKWREVFLSRLKLHLPHIKAALNSSDFPFGENEVQLTASNDGDYFKPHRDSSEQHEEVASREITFVYYFHRTPRRYSGGNLLLYQGQPGGHAYDVGKAVCSIAPENNCLIAFASNRWHEVDIVRCPSAAFADSRFTVNGWLRRQSS